MQVSVHVCVWTTKPIAINVCLCVCVCVCDLVSYLYDEVTLMPCMSKI